jgi:ActR/RegA family two-component response regulator
MFAVNPLVSLLIIDDDEPLIEILRVWLGKRTIRVAHSMREAESQIAESAPEHIVLDLALPDSNPAKTIERIRDLKRLSKDAVVIVVTGWPAHEAAARAGGADKFFVKKTADDLGRQIGRELEGPDKKDSTGAE